MTAAQLEQQGNRGTDGRYAPKIGADQGDQALHTSQAVQWPATRREAEALDGILRDPAWARAIAWRAAPALALAQAVGAQTGATAAPDPIPVSDSDIEAELSGVFGTRPNQITPHPANSGLARAWADAQAGERVWLNTGAGRAWFEVRGTRRGAQLVPCFDALARRKEHAMQAYEDKREAEAEELLEREHQTDMGRRARGYVF